MCDLHQVMLKEREKRGSEGRRERSEIIRVRV